MSELWILFLARNWFPGLLGVSGGVGVFGMFALGGGGGGGGSWPVCTISENVDVGGGGGGGGGGGLVSCMGNQPRTRRACTF